MLNDEIQIEWPTDSDYQTPKFMSYDDAKFYLQVPMQMWFYGILCSEASLFMKIRSSYTEEVVSNYTLTCRNSIKFDGFRNYYVNEQDQITIA